MHGLNDTSTRHGLKTSGHGQAVRHGGEVERGAVRDGAFRGWSFEREENHLLVLLRKDALQMTQPASNVTGIRLLETEQGTDRRGPTDRYRP